VVAPFKLAFFLKMIEHFSANIETSILVPSYPRTRTTRTQRAAFKDATGVFFGDGRARMAIRQFKPDVFYSDNPLYGCQLKLSEHLGNPSIPTIIHLRGDLWREFFGWVRRSPIKSRLLGSPVHFSSLLGISLADKVAPICRWLQREVRRHLPSKPTEVVYQGVDPSDFFPSPGLRLAHPAVAIIQNHTVFEKTLGLLKFARVVEGLPDVHFYITTGEDVRQTYFPSVEANFSRLKNAHFLRGISHPEGVRRLLTSSDVYALPSELDCCPTTILEASLMKKPVLASRVGGIPEIISEGRTGWSLLNDRPGEWIERITTLTADTKLSRRLGAEGRKWVASNFGWEKITRQVERLITQAAEGRLQ
jgi:glycosyltransferase involved in cell wall biosynthesis